MADTVALGTLQQVAAGVFAYVQPDGTWFINNAGFVLDDGGLSVIDTCGTERRTRAFLDAIARTTAMAPARLLLTHHHADHTNGNGLVRAPVIIGHERTRERMLMAGGRPGPDIIDPVDFGQIAPIPPDVVFNDRQSVIEGERRLLLSYVGRPAHSDNDVIVWLPDERVLFSGDIVMHGSMPLAMEGSVSGILYVLRGLLELDPRVVVPGHGSVGGPELIEKTIRYYELVTRLAGSAARTGHTPIEAARAADLGEFAGLLDPERIVANLHRAMFESKARGVQEPSTPMLFSEMRAFKGRPLRCVA